MPKCNTWMYYADFWGTQIKIIIVYFVSGLWKIAPTEFKLVRELGG